MIDGTLLEEEQQKYFGINDPRGELDLSDMKFVSKEEQDFCGNT